MKNKEKRNKQNNFKNNIIIFATMFGLLFIALLSFYPGIMTIDGNNQWNQVLSNNIINNHPFLSTFVWWLLSKIWFAPTTLMLLQIFLLSVIWTSICNELGKETKLLRKIIYTIIMCFVPIIFMYAITAWKDIIYSYMLLLLALMIYIGIKKDFQYSYWNIFILSLCLVLIASYRYNGMIVTGLALVMFFIIFLKKKYGWKKILCSLGIFILLFTFCKIPEKIMCHPEKNESANDIALFILAANIVEDKVDDKNDLAIINEVYPIEKLKKEYNPYCINSMSFSQYYNRENAKTYNKDIIRMLVKYSIKNPITVVKHYLKSDNLLISLSFGDRNGQGQGYVYIYEFSEWYTKYTGNFDKIVNPVLKSGYDFYLKLVNGSTNDDLLRKFYLPAVPLYLSIILVFIYTRKKKDNKYYLVLAPMILNTISLLPINVAQDLRYAYINYLTLLLIVIPLFLFDKRKEKSKMIENKEKQKYDKVLVIIPAYNEAKTIKKVVNNVYEQNIANCDVIVINDGSKDNTFKEAKQTKAIVIDSPNNLGIGGAVQTGYLYALKNDYDIAIQIDGDGQHNPKYIRNLVEEIQKGNDIVIGSRFIEKSEYDQTKLRMLGINIISFTIKLMTKIKIYDTTSGYRAVNKNIIKEFSKEYPYDYPEPCTNMSMIKKGYKVKEIPVEMEKRQAGISSISPLKSIVYMFKVILSILLMGLKD